MTKEEAQKRATIKLVIEIDKTVFESIKERYKDIEPIGALEILLNSVANGTPLTKDNAKRQLSMILAEIEFESELEACKTVEDVEALQCTKCARNHHWGWCDAPHE